MQQRGRDARGPSSDPNARPGDAVEGGRLQAPRGTRVTTEHRSLVARAIGGLALIAALYFARGVLIPLAVAGVLALVLAPIVNRLGRWGLANGVAVLGVVGVAMTALVATAILVTSQALTLLDSLPKYRTNIRERIHSIVSTDPGVLGRTAELVGDIQGDIAREIEDATPPASDVEEPAKEPAQPSLVAADVRGTQLLERLQQALDGDGPPISVAVTKTNTSPIASARAMIGPVLAPLASAGIVLVFLTFFLLSRRDLNDRLLQLAGRGHLRVTAVAIDEASARISNYLLAHVTLNFIYGVPVAVVLWALGLPGAALWGLLAALLRFIPYVGPWVSALLPLALSLAVFDDWSKPMYVAGTFLALELVSNNVLEPWLYGSKSGLSTVAVLLAALFWGWLWGPLGIVLAVPLTVILVVLGRYVPPLAPFTILFGDERSLPEGMRFYHRVLAGDEAGATQLALRMRAASGALGLADGLLVPATAEEKRDRHHGSLDPLLSDRFWEFVEDLAASLATGDDEPERPVVDIGVAEDTRPSTWCVPISDDAEALSAQLLAQLLKDAGERAEVVAAEDDALGARTPPSRIVVLACAPIDKGRMRRALRVLRRIATGGELVVHIAGQELDAPLMERLGRLGATRVVTSLGELLEPDPLRPAEDVDSPAGRAVDEPTREQPANVA